MSVKTLIALLIALFVPALVTAQNPQQVADELLGADRALLSGQREDGPCRRPQRDVRI